jgi:hypothetical protein
MQTLLGTIRDQLKAYKPNTRVKAWKQTTVWSFGVEASWPYLDQFDDQHWAEVVIDATDDWLDASEGKPLLSKSAIFPPLSGPRVQPPQDHAALTGRESAPT